VTAWTTKKSDGLFVALLVAAVASLVVSLQVIFLRAPIEASMGIVQKVFYFHVPAAYGMYLGATACFAGSVGYLSRGTLGWDAFARAGADVAVAMGLMVMISGPLWASKSWGRYWDWDPRLIASLMCLMLYMGYGVLRAFSGSTEAVRRFAAALGVLGMALVPMIHLSVHKWGGQHPKVISKGGGGIHHLDMKLALAAGFVTFTLLTIVLVWQRMGLHQATSRFEALEQEALELGVAGD